MLNELSSRVLAFELLAFAATAATFVLAANRWQSLPDDTRIPSHFSLTGRPDAWSRKAFLWFYPLVSLAMLAGLLVVQIVVPGSGEGMAPTALLMTGMMFFILMRSMAVAEKRTEGLGRFFLLGLVLALAAYILYMQLVVDPT
jgi:hypothetical protein